MQRLSTSSHPHWVSNVDRSRVINISGLNYELRVVSRTTGRLTRHELVAGTPRLVSVIDIPLSRAGLESMFDYKTTSAIINLLGTMRTI